MSAAPLSAPPDAATTKGPVSGRRSNANAAAKRSRISRITVALCSARRALDFAADLAFADRLSLVMKFLTTAYSQFDLRTVLPKI